MCLHLRCRQPEQDLLFCPESLISLPRNYTGELGTCSRFLLQCTLIFRQQPLYHASDEAWGLTSLASSVAKWPCGRLLCGSTIPRSVPLETFTKERKRVFDHPLGGKEAASRLLFLQQGSRSVADYAVEFQMLAMESRWDEPFSGSSDMIRDELAVRDKVNSLNELISLATRLDNRMRERCRERGNWEPTPFPVSASGLAPPILQQLFHQNIPSLRSLCKSDVPGSHQRNSSGDERRYDASTALSWATSWRTVPYAGVALPVKHLCRLVPPPVKRNLAGSYLLSFCPQILSHSSIWFS